MRPEHNVPRLDRLATLYFWHPLLRACFSRNAARVPILMYHSISDHSFGKTNPYYQINTSPEIFAHQMRCLKELGYRTLEIGPMLEAMERGEDLSKCVIITFDDGYRDFCAGAMDVLLECGFTAYIYLVTERIRKTSYRLNGVDYLSWSDVRDLYSAGIRFGSHTVTHPDLRSIKGEQVEHELADSRKCIEDNLGIAVTSFAYPFAFPEQDKRFISYFHDLLVKSGYANGVCTSLGRASLAQNRYFLRRLPVNSWDDEPLFSAKLEGGYDWLYWAQRLKKYFAPHGSRNEHSKPS